jgi:hypothetical protein
MSPYVTGELILHYGLTALLGGGGAWLLWRTRPEAHPKPEATIGDAVDALAWPKVSKWMQPAEAINEFADRGLMQELEAALVHYEEARRRRDEESKKFHEENPTYTDQFRALKHTGLGYRTELDEFQKAQVDVQIARDKVINNVRQQLADAYLVAKGLEFTEGKLEGGHRVTIPPAYWSELRFESYNAKMEVVSGGGKKYTSVRIGKDESTRPDAH